MASIKIPKCPYCGTSENMTCELVKNGDTLETRWHCTACGASFTIADNDSSDKGPYNIMQSLDDAGAPAENRNLSGLAGEKIFRGIWLADAYKKKVISKVNEAKATIQNETDAREKAARDQELAKIYHLLLAGFILLFVLLAYSVIMALVMLYVPDFNTRKIIYVWFILPVVAVLAPTICIVVAALHLWNARGAKLLDAAIKEREDATNRLNTEIKNIESDVRKELDSELVRNGYAPMDDDEIPQWQEDNNQSKKIKKNKD